LRIECGHRRFQFLEHPQVQANQEAMCGVIRPSRAPVSSRRCKYSASKPRRGPKKAAIAVAASLQSNICYDASRSSDMKSNQLPDPRSRFSVSTRCRHEESHANDQIHRIDRLIS
jgi:hypothetical protein